jgi:hypothetical protein
VESRVPVQVLNESFEIVMFEVKPARIKRGETARLSWLTTGPVTAVAILPDIGALTTKGGVREVSPAKDTTYTLTIQAGGKILTKQVKLRVH